MGHFERATQLLALLPPDRLRRLRLELALGRAALRASDTRRARATFELAAQDAASLGDSEGLARAALGYQDARAPTGAVDPTEITVCSSARSMRSGVATVRCGREWSSDWGELDVRGPARAMPALVDEALAIARRVGDPTALATALFAKHFLSMGPGDLRERLPILTEAIERAEAGHVRGVAFGARVSWCTTSSSPATSCPPSGRSTGSHATPSYPACRCTAGTWPCSGPASRSRPGEWRKARACPPRRSSCGGTVKTLPS